LADFSTLSAPNLFLMLDHATPAGHARKHDMKLQKFCGSGFFLFAARMFAKRNHLDGVNWLKTLVKTKMQGRFLHPLF